MKIRPRIDLIAAAAILLWLPAQLTHAQKIGEVGYLKGPEGAGSVPVFTDSKALNAFYKANASNDKEGIEELFNARRLFMVDAATQIRVLDSYGFFGSTMEVRILEGEFRNQRGFVSSQWVVEGRAKLMQKSNAQSYAEWNAEWHAQQRTKAALEAKSLEVKAERQKEGLAGLTPEQWRKVHEKEFAEVIRESDELMVPAAKAEREAYVQAHPEFGQTVINRQIAIGMAKEDLIASWGRPKNVDTSVSGHTTNERWFYSLIPHLLEMGSVDVYFENGRVSSWQKGR